MPFLTYGNRYMNQIEQLAHAALARDHLTLRSLVQDLARSKTDFSKATRPSTQDARLLVTTAAFVELLASRNNQTPPAWTQDIGALSEPFFLLENAITMKRLRILCEQESPEPMRRRLLYAPPHFLEFA
jgi:hypothetical protein